MSQQKTHCGHIIVFLVISHACLGAVHNSRFVGDKCDRHNFFAADKNVSGDIILCWRHKILYVDISGLHAGEVCRRQIVRWEQRLRQRWLARRQRSCCNRQLHGALRVLTFCRCAAGWWSYPWHRRTRCRTPDCGTRNVLPLRWPMFPRRCLPWTATVRTVCIDRQNRYAATRNKQSDFPFIALKTLRQSSSFPACTAIRVRRANRSQKSLERLAEVARSCNVVETTVTVVSWTKC